MTYAKLSATSALSHQVFSSSVATVADINALIQHMDKATAQVKTLCANGVGIKDIQKQVTPLLVAQQPTWLLNNWISMELQADYAHLCGNK